MNEWSKGERVIIICLCVSVFHSCSPFSYLCVGVYASVCLYRASIRITMQNMKNGNKIKEIL